MALTDLPRRARNAFSLSGPSWARAWRGRSPARDGRDGPRIAVVGNCQARGIVAAMRLLAPRAAVHHLPMGSLRRDHGTLEGLARTLAGFDHAFAQSFAAGLIPGGDSAALHARAPGLRLFPTVVFSAFHPDVVYAGGGDDAAAPAHAPSPLGLYHSAIALTAHRLGLDPGRAAGLFREDVFARLGYLDHWEPAARELTRLAGSLGFGLERELTRWARRGAFMHVVNHPKAFVLGDIARRLLTESGLEAEAVGVEDYLGDELARDAVWPIYPPVADLYGIPGSYLFKARPRGEAFPRLYDLDAFLAASFAIYDGLGPAALACPRVETWVSAPWIREIFLDT